LTASQNEYSPAMRLEPFELERMQSTFENEVEFNLSESGVQPLSVGDLVEDVASKDALLSETLRYTQTNGTPRLRAAISALYPGATADHVQVTNGGSEANFVTTWHLVEPGDEVVLMTPNYMQMPALARAFGATVKEWPLVHDPGAVKGEGGRSPAEAPRCNDSRGEGGWRVDTDALDRLVSAKTRMIVVCNPNNPTGARFDADTLDRIVATAARCGAWVLSDEIYRGAELDGRETPSMWGRYERVVVTSGLSKAYGLPGLRIGWAVGPPALVASLWACHDYTTIAPGALSDALARRALEPTQRARILARTRRILTENFPIVADWLDGYGDLFTYTAPDAGAIVFARYHHAINSTELVTRLRQEKGVLLVPGDHFGMDHYLRFGFGDAPGHLRGSLDRVSSGIAQFRLQ
jgi:aspartate/methionine/tyrosine aminotransferase